MKNSFLGTLIAVMLFSISLSSCDVGNTYSNEASSDCAINSMVLGTLTRDVHTTTTSGKDSVYTTTFTGSLYNLYIDQYKQIIYNPDSLPLGTHINKILFSSASCDGVMAYKTVSGNDTVYSTSDTIDFTTPRIFTCYANTGTSKKVYTVHVNMHQVDPEKFVWNQVHTSNNTLKDAKIQRALCKDSTIYNFVVTSTDTLLLTSSINDGEQWNTTSLHIDGFNPGNVQLFKGTFYALKQGEIISSTDGITWNSAGATITADALPAVSSNMLFALKDQKMYYSKDGISWTEDELENANYNTYLPTENFTSTYYTTRFNDNFENIIMGGKYSEGNIEWKKTIDNKGDNTEPWSLYKFGEEKNHPFPSLPDTKVIYYDSKIYALGIEGDTLSLFQVSVDYGCTWRPYKESYLHPAGIKASNFTWIIDEKNFMWIFCGGSGEIWRGRINRLGFKINKTAFTE